MSKNSITLYSNVKYGRLEPHIGSVLNAKLHSLSGKKAKITIEEAKAVRSINQNSYYWGVVLPMIVNAINEYGNDFDADEIHVYIKLNVVKSMKNNVYLPDGTVTKTIKSTRKLSKAEFSDYIEKIKIWAFEQLKISIPDANSNDQK